MAKKEQIKVGLEVEGLRDAIKAFNKLDKETQNQVRDAVVKIAQNMANQIASTGKSLRDPRYGLLASSVRASRDRVPVVYIGGRVNPKASGGGGPNQLLFGMEFGAESRRNSWRFPPRSEPLRGGNEGYWIFPTARRQQPEVLEAWQEALDAGLATFAVGGTNRKDGDLVSGSSFGF